jgi:integrase
LKYHQLQNGKYSITLRLPDDRQCTVKTDCTSATEVKQVAKIANLEAVEALAKSGKLTAALIRKLTIGGTMPTSQAISEWKAWLKATANSELTALTYQRDLEVWYVEQLPERLMDVSEDRLSAWINKEDESKASTRNKRLAALRSFFGWCAAKDYLSPNPALTIRLKMKALTHEQKETDPSVPFTDVEFQKVVDYLMGEICFVYAIRKPKARLVRRLRKMEFWHAAVHIGRTTGLRLGDICCLEWKCFDLQAKTITVWTDKSDERIVIPITNEVQNAISRIPEKSTGEVYCFPKQRLIANNPLKRHQLCTEFWRILQAARVTGHSFHDLRHTRATELYQSGMSLDKIAQYMAHRSTDVTARYIHKHFYGI